ncbi:MAG: polysaccharide deacetylase family protein [bacterium]
MRCENHPERQSGARCQYCWKALCPDCQIRVKDQIFCSRHCNFLFHIKDVRLRCQQALFKHNLYLRSKIDHLNKYSTFLLILIGLGTGLILVYSTSTEERHTLPPVRVVPSAAGNTGLDSVQMAGQDKASPIRLKEQKALEEEILPPSDHQATASLLPLPIPLPLAGNMNEGSDDTLAHETAAPLSFATEQICSDFQISLAPHRPQQPSYIIDIYGNAPPNSIIALYKNDRLCDTVPCRGERFLFARIGLERDKNTLQAKMITADGNLCYSNTLELVVDGVTSQVVEKGLDIRRGDLSLTKICLTFDSGESADEAPYILDILKEKNIRTTIFLTGEFIRRNANIVKRIIKDGHEVGNHTDTHPHLTRVENRRIICLPGVNRQFLHHELKKAEEAFFNLTGKHMSHYWRSPYGENNLEIRKWAEELGYIHVSWTCGRVWEDGLDSLDWVTNTDSIKYHTAEEIRNQIINFGTGTERGANGGIVLMHFSTSRPRQDAVYLQLPDIIDGLHKRGYEIVSISQMLPKASPQEEKKSRHQKAPAKRSSETPRRRSAR